MNSVTKSTPVFNAKTGVISYVWDDLVQEKPLCPHCGEIMKYWYSRKRGVIISDYKYTFMSPRFKCSCGRTITMRPYFIAERKQYSIFSIQEIINADASGNTTVSTAYGSSMVGRFRKWAVAFVKGLVPDVVSPNPQDERSIVHELFQQNGGCWLVSFLQNRSNSRPFSMVPCPSG